MQCIYSIKSQCSGKRYIGSTKSFSKRVISHKYHLRRGTHDNRHLQHHTKKYGLDDLVFEILEYVEDCDKLLIREQHHIDTMNPEFNICKVAGRVTGREVSEHTRKLMSLKNKGQKRSEEICRRMSESHKGKPNNWLNRKHSDESKRKMSIVFSGRVASEETKRRISESLMGHVVTEETRRKLSIAHTGKTMSESHRENMRLAAKNRPPVSDETRKKLSESGKGRVFSDIHRERLSKSQKKTRVVQIDELGNVVAMYDGVSVAARATGIYRGSISMVITGKQKTAGGFIWKYADE